MNGIHLQALGGTLYVFTMGGGHCAAGPVAFPSASGDTQGLYTTSTLYSELNVFNMHSLSRNGVSDAKNGFGG